MSAEHICFSFCNARRKTFPAKSRFTFRPAELPPADAPSAKKTCRPLTIDDNITPALMLTDVDGPTTALKAWENVKIQFMINCQLSLPSLNATSWSSTAKDYVSHHFALLEKSRNILVTQYARLPEGDRDLDFFIRQNTGIVLPFFRVLYVLLGRRKNDPLDLAKVKEILSVSPRVKRLFGISSSAAEQLHNPTSPPPAPPRS